MSAVFFLLWTDRLYDMDSMIYKNIHRLHANLDDPACKKQECAVIRITGENIQILLFKTSAC